MNRLWKSTLTLMLLSLICSVKLAFAQLGSVPFVFSSGTTISSSAVNAAFSTAYSLALNRTGGTMTGTLTTQQVTPSATATYDLGVTGTRFRDLWLSRNAAVGGTLGVTGAATLSSTLGVTGAATLSSTLDVTGITTLGTLNAVATGITGTLTTHDLLAAANATYDLGVTGTRYRDLWLSRNAAIGGTLGVTGAATLSSTLDVTSTLTVSGTTTTHGIVPTTHATYDIGVTGTRFVNAWLSGDLNALNVNASTVLSGAGLVGTPSFTFTADTATGMYKAGASTLGFATAGASRLTISTTAISSGLRIDSNDFYREKSRTFGIGETQTHTFSALDYGALGGGSITVGSGDVTGFTHRVIGDTLFVNVSLATVTVAGSVSVITIAIPGGFTAQEATAQIVEINDNGTINFGVASVVAGGTVINVVRINGGSIANFSAATDASGLALHMNFKVS